MHPSALRAPPLPSYTTGQARRGGGFVLFLPLPLFEGEIERGCILLSIQSTRLKGLEF